MVTSKQTLRELEVAPPADNAPKNEQLSKLFEESEVYGEFFVWSSGEAAVRMFDRGNGILAVHINSPKNWIYQSLELLNMNGEQDRSRLIEGKRHAQRLG